MTSLQRKLPTHPHRHQNQHALQRDEDDPDVPPFAFRLARIRVAPRIQHPRRAPRSPQSSREQWELETRDQHGDDEARVVLDEVAVGPLRAVEQVQRLSVLGALGGGEIGLLGVDLRHFDLCRFAVGHEAEGKPGAEEGGGSGCEEDVATS